MKLKRLMFALLRQSIAPAAILAGAAFSGAVSGQTTTGDYPNRTIRLVVSFPAGGGSDTVARIVGERLSKSFGQQVLIENRPGGGANIGAAFVAKAPPDGYTLLVATPPQTINPALVPKLSPDPVKEFAPAAPLVFSTMLLAAHPSVPARSVKDLIALAKARPGQFNYSSPGSGTAAHLAAELFRMMAGIDIVHVPYKGAAPALTDLIAGQVSFSITSAPPVLPHLQSGRLRVLAVTSPQRSAALPDVPTIAQAGLPGYEVTNWYGVLAPAGTSRAIVDKLNAELTRIVTLPDVRKQLSTQGVEPFTATPQQFVEFIKSEIAKWAKVIKDSGARVD